MIYLQIFCHFKLNKSFNNVDSLKYQPPGGPLRAFEELKGSQKPYVRNILQWGSEIRIPLGRSSSFPAIKPGH